MNPERSHSPLDALIGFCIDNKLVVGLFILLFIGWGILVAPFDWDLPGVPRNPVAVDAIPDIGENQQIVFTEWPGRSPQDVEDQITYPLTVSLLGVPGVKTIRSYSFFGFSSIYIIFSEEVDFYWSRSRVLEKLNSLPSGILPVDAQPALGPDATGLGQIFWYTLEGMDPEGNPTGGWDLHELRTIQDWHVRYALQGVEGVSEVSSIGGFVQEYQIDVDPDAMRAFGVSLTDVFEAVRMSNVDVGAQTIEINNVEYMIRGLGFIQGIDDIENTIITTRDHVPVYIRNVAHVTLGPQVRRGALDKGGAEAVGGVVVARYGKNPLETINNVKDKIAEIAPGLPRKVLSDGTESQVVIVPFYDRTDLIYETLGTLNTALIQQVLVTVIVVLVMVFHLRSSLLISGLLPLAVLMTFIAMKVFGVDANIVALSGIAIAIGTMVDMGIVISENILRHLDAADPKERRRDVIFRAATEVGSAVLTAVLTTVISFLPVFAMEAAEGKMFKPLAFTKTFALIASIIVALTIIPAMAHLLTGGGGGSRRGRTVLDGALILAGVATGAWLSWGAGVALMAFGVYRLVEVRLHPTPRQWAASAMNGFLALFVCVVLAQYWVPLGPEAGLKNIVFVVCMIGSLVAFFYVFRFAYVPLLRWCLDHKLLAMTVPAALVVWGLVIWLGFGRVFAFVPKGLEYAGVEPSRIYTTPAWSKVIHEFPGLGKEFMPPLDEGSFLFMPSLMPHASIGKSVEILQKQDMAIGAIPEVESVVGKIGRVDSPLDPAPVAMTETVINYMSEYATDERGRRLRFQYDASQGEFARDAEGNLIPDANGRPYRQWRPHIKSPDDIWNEIVRVTEIPGATNAPKLQPIATRLLMLQTGMRAPMGVKVYGPDLETIEAVGFEIERHLKRVPYVKPETVLADRVVGKPYLEIDIDRHAIARYGMTIRQVQDVIEVAIGGKPITTTVEGRERYPVRVRYMRELRDDIESLERILVTASDGAQIPLGQLASINYRPGPDAIKSEDTFLVSYVIFDKQPGHAEVDVVEAARRYLEEKRRTGEFVLPAGVSYRFTGNYENELRASERLRVVLPLALFIIFLIIYFQFKSVSTTLLVFTGIATAWAGGFQMLWLYSQDWFLDFAVAGVNMRDLFQINPVNLSVAVWVGFLALFGIATDDGVIMATYIKQSFQRHKPESVAEIRTAVLEAASRRIRPCLMTTATTVLALIPVLTSSGRGADIMIPMAIPSFGGMTVVMVSVFVVPTLYAAVEEFRHKRAGTPESAESTL